MARVVFYTFGVLREDKGSERTKAFYRRMPAVFKLAEGTPGFLDRREDGDFAFGPPRFYRKGEHVRAPQTLSLWRDVPSLRVFVKNPAHAEVLAEASEWLINPEWPSYVAWWVDDHHVPSWQEAWEKLALLHDNGPTAEAFNIDLAFDADGQPLPSEETSAV
jgi:hypothetical protein